MKTLNANQWNTGTKISYELTGIDSVEFETLRFDNKRKEHAIVIHFAAGTTATLKAADWYITFE